MDLEGVKQRLSCGLCNEIFTCPKFLPDCNHIFCEHCLRSYIIETVPVDGHRIMDYIDGKIPTLKSTGTSFQCPLEDCKKENKPYDPMGSTKWIYQCYNAQNLISVLNMCRTKVGPAAGWSCHYCENMALTVRASHVCFNHLRLYCSKCVFVHNQTYKNFTECSKLTYYISDVQGFLHRDGFAPGTDEKSKSTLKACTPTFCKIHPGFEIEFNCRKCKVECCSFCRDTVHGKCAAFLSKSSAPAVPLPDKEFEKRLNSSLSEVIKLKETYEKLLKRIKQVTGKESDGMQDIENTESPRSECSTEISQGAENCKCEECSLITEIVSKQFCTECQVDRCTFLKLHIEKLESEFSKSSRHSEMALHLVDVDIREVEQEIFCKTGICEKQLKEAESLLARVDRVRPHSVVKNCN